MKVWLWTLAVAVLAGLAYGLNAGWAAEADEFDVGFEAAELEATPQDAPKLAPATPVAPAAPSAPARP